jgi:signal transduction histidine kinase/putative methionine-R-sulfoxide reductase with GAF domain
MLTRIARRLAVTGTDLGASFELLTSGAITLLCAEGAVLARLDGDTLSVESAAGSLTPMTGFHAPLAGSLAIEALRTGSVVVLNEAAGDPRVEAHFLAPFGPRQVVVAPIMIDQEARGFLLALNSARGAFSCGDATLLQQLADHGAIVVRHVELHARLEAAAEKSNYLSEIVQQINQSLELERVQMLLARHAADVLAARGARVAMLDEDRLVVVATAGDATDPLGSTSDLETTFAGQAVRRRTTERTTDLRAYADQWARPPARRQEGAGDGRANAVVAPLLVGGRAIGAVTVFGNEEHDFTVDDATLLLSLANHAAIAIENARLYRAAAHAAHHGNTLAAAARALAFSTTSQGVYQAISQVARDALGAEGFTVVLLDTETGHLKVAHTEGAGTAVHWSAERFPSTIPGQVADSGAPVYATSMDAVFSELSPGEVAVFRAASVRSVAFLPLPPEASERGVLILRFTAARRFDQHERRLLEDFASLIAVAMRNTRLAAAERDGRERERALAEAMHQTEKLAAIGELVAGVAHELNNPLTGISTFAQLLLADPLDDEQRESVQTIKREADRAVGVIRDLLVFSRKTGPRLVTVDVNALVQQTLRLRGYALQSAGVEVRTALAPDLPIILGDDQKLQQVLLNLVVNAEYAMHRRDARVLTVRTSWKDTGAADRVVLEIADTGTGMTPELAKHIFEPFFTTKPAGVGTGLGLSVSYGIVQAHGGTITAHTTPGAGSTFTVTLPLRSAATPPPPSPSEPHDA